MAADVECTNPSCIRNATHGTTIIAAKMRRALLNLKISIISIIAADSTIGAKTNTTNRPPPPQRNAEKLNCIKNCIAGANKNNDIAVVKSFIAAPREIIFTTKSRKLFSLRRIEDATNVASSERSNLSTSKSPILRHGQLWPCVHLPVHPIDNFSEFRSERKVRFITKILPIFEPWECSTGNQSDFISLKGFHYLLLQKLLLV